MKYVYPTFSRLIFLGLMGASSLAQAKVCTESNIRDAVSSGKSFDYQGEGCSNKDGIITIKSGINVNRSNWKFDGKGIARLVWKGGGGCDKTPRSADFAFFDLNGNKNTLANFSAEGAPEGIHVSTGKGNAIVGVTFPFICEDAITNGTKKSNSATDTLISKSNFRKSDDKAIQINGGSIIAEDNTFKDVYRSIGMCSVKADPGNHPALPCGYKGKITARRNHVDGCQGYAMRSAGKDSAKGGILIAENNTIVNCSTPFQVEEEGYAEIRGNQMLGSCDTGLKVLTSKGSAVYGCGNKNSCRNRYSGNVKAESPCTSASLKALDATGPAPNP